MPRGWIAHDNDPERAYIPPVEEGQVMRAYGIYKVIDSKAESRPKGSLVTAFSGWTQYSVAVAKGCTPIQEIPGISVTHWIGALGGTGLTAYYGLVSQLVAPPSTMKRAWRRLAGKAA